MGVQMIHRRVNPFKEETFTEAIKSFQDSAKGQISAILKGNTWTNRAGIGDTSPQTIENLDSAKTYLLIKTDGGTVNVDAVDTAVPAKITGKTSTVLTWASGKIALYELSTAEAALTEAQLGARYHYVSGTKSTVSAGRIKAVGKNLFDKNSATKGYYASDGHFYTGVNNIVTDFIPTITNMNLKSNTTFQKVICFDNNKNYLSQSSYGSVFTPYNIPYVKFQYDINAVNIDTLQLEKGTVATPYEPYTESIAYIPNVGELRSLPNGTKDEVRVSENKLIKRIGDKTNVASGTVIDYSDMTTGGQFVAYASDGTSQVGVKGDTLTITATTLTYQLAEEIVTEIHPRIFYNNKTFEYLMSFENMTLMQEPVMPVEDYPDESGQLTIPGTNTLLQSFKCYMNANNDEDPIYIDVTQNCALDIETRKITIANYDVTKKYFAAVDVAPEESTLGTITLKYEKKRDALSPRCMVVG